MGDDSEYEDDVRTCNSVWDFTKITLNFMKFHTKGSESTAIPSAAADNLSLSAFGVIAASAARKCKGGKCSIR